MAAVIPSLAAMAGDEATSAHFRADARRTVALSATVRDEAGRFAWRARVCDLGLGGAGLELVDAAAAGQRIVLEIAVPTRWDPLIVRGVIAWVRAGSGREPWRVGVRFAFEDGAAAWGLWDVLGAEVYD